MSVNDNRCKLFLVWNKCILNKFIFTRECILIQEWLDIYTKKKDKILSKKNHFWQCKTNLYHSFFFILKARRALCIRPLWTSSWTPVVNVHSCFCRSPSITCWMSEARWGASRTRTCPNKTWSCWWRSTAPWSPQPPAARAARLTCRRRSCGAASSHRCWPTRPAED